MSSLICYEVNLEIDAAIEAEYRTWLRTHINEMLALPGFVSAQCFDILDPAPVPGRIALCVQYGVRDAQIWHYVALRAPQIVARFLPFSVLLGTILTLITMNQNSEVVALKAAGMSAHQVLAPLIVASLGVAVLSFAFNDRIVPRATATLNRWQKVDYLSLIHI